MPNSSPRRRWVIVILTILLLLAFLLVRCSCSRMKDHIASSAADSPATTPQPTVATPTTTAPPEVLTPATVQVPPKVGAGSVFAANWTGPNNLGDYLTIVRNTEPDSAHANYSETRAGSPMELTAPIDPGEWEVRYIAVRSRTVLGRAPLTVVASEAALSAPAEAIAGSAVVVTWTGPNNPSDYITLVAKTAPDGEHAASTYTNTGSPLVVTAPVEAGDAELRYMTGQRAKVLARRPIRIVAAEVSLSAPGDAIAGSAITVTWTGPNNAGDYITIVPKAARDGEHMNNTYTAKGSPLTITAPIEPGETELRYMTGQGAKVLARRSIKIIAANITLSAPTDAVAGSNIAVTWTGPNNPGDYITVVVKAARDGEHAASTYTNKGSPLTVTAPIDTGEVEVRYMTGQGGKVLARRPVKVVAAVVTLSAPDEALAGSKVAVTWTGPNNAGDIITLVARTARDGEHGPWTYTNTGSPLTVVAPKEAGDLEVRYMSGQGAKALQRRPIKITAAK